MGQEAEYEQRVRDFAGYQVTEALCREGGADPNWKFMHCLPRKKHEVDDEVRTFVYHSRSSPVPKLIAFSWRSSMVLAPSCSQKLITASGPLWPRLSEPPAFFSSLHRVFMVPTVCFLESGISLVNAAARNARIPRMSKALQICKYLRKSRGLQNKTSFSHGVSIARGPIVSVHPTFAYCSMSWASTQA